MKSAKSLLFAATLASFALTFGGCTDWLAPPAYSSSENSQRIWRYMDYDRAQLIEDFDRDVTMTRPHSSMTMWDLAHHD